MLRVAHYDKEMVNARNNHRNRMVDILNHFHYAELSRAKQNGTGHWAVCLNRKMCGVDERGHLYSNDQEQQFQATNCEVCGNYQNSPTFGRLVDMSDVECGERFLIRFSRMLDAMPTRMRCQCNFC